MFLGDVKRCTLVVKWIIDLQHLLAPEPVKNLRLVCGVGVSLAQVTWRTTYCRWPLISSGSWIEMHAHIVSYMYSICIYICTSLTLKQISGACFSLELCLSSPFAFEPAVTH